MVEEEFNYKIRIDLGDRIQLFSTDHYEIKDGRIIFRDRQGLLKNYSADNKTLIGVETMQEYLLAKVIKQEGIQLTIICPHCGLEHKHGTGGPEFNKQNEWGLRVPHCSAEGKEKAGIPANSLLTQYRLVRK